MSDEEEKPEKQPEIVWQGNAWRTVGGVMRVEEARAVLDPRWTPERIVCEWKGWDAMGEAFWLAAESSEDRDAILTAAVVHVARFGDA